MNLPVRFTRATHVAATAVACGLLLTLASCRIPSLRPADPGPDLPGSFNGTTTPDNSAQLRVDEFFGDPLLLNLITQALGSNLELKIRNQEILIANNEVLARIGAYLPFLSLGTSAGLEKASRYTVDGAAERRLDYAYGKHFPEPMGNFMIAGNVSWQVDIWRKLRNARDAAAWRYLATAEGRNYVVTRLVADIAENYYGLMALDRRLEILDQTIAIQEQSRLTAKARFDAGQGTELPVQRFQAEVRKNESEKLIVRQEIIEVENRINFLVGRYPQTVERSTADFIDLNIHAVSVGVPSQLLQNRPDIRQAERELEAAGLDVKVARAEFFPSLDIAAGIGYEAFNPRYLFDPGAFAGNLAGNLTAPLINRKAIQAAYGSANAKQLQAVYNYQRVILDAFTEVVNRVTMAENYRKSIELKKQQLQALDLSVKIATQLFQAARGEYIDVLFSQRDFLDARTTLIDTKRQQLSAVVNAYQALGGGDVMGPAYGAQPQPQGPVNIAPPEASMPAPAAIPGVAPAAPQGGPAAAAPAAKGPAPAALPLAPPPMPLPKQ